MSLYLTKNEFPSLEFYPFHLQTVACVRESSGYGMKWRFILNASFQFA